MNSLWVKKLEQLQEEERQAAIALDREIGDARDRYEEKRGRLDRKRRALDLMRDDPIVVVRHSFGPRPTKYHLASSKCGWKPQDGERLLKSEAERRRLEPCSSWFCQEALTEAAEKGRRSV